MSVVNTTINALASDGGQPQETVHFQLWELICLHESRESSRSVDCKHIYMDGDWKKRVEDADSHKNGH
jgi:hypothetical protein